MKEYFGWTQSSKIATVYVHLSGRDVDKALLKVYGIANNDDEKHETEFKPKACMRCEESNPPTNKYCKRCGLPLDRNAILEIIGRESKRAKYDDILDKLLSDTELIELMTKKINQMQVC
jgi:integrase/recombinase XerD